MNMQTAKWLIFLILLGIGVFVILHQNLPETPTPVNTNTDSIKVEVRKRLDEKGPLKSDVEMVKGINHGKAHNYYDNGKVHSEITYVQGVKEGNSIWFHENGNPYRITPFKNGKIEGIQKKYYKSGKLMAEIPYVNNVLVEGTKEYNEFGTLLNDVPPFTVKWLPTNDQSNAFIELKTKKKDVIEAIVVKYILNGIASEKTYQLSGNQLTIPITFNESGMPKVTVLVTYKTKLNNQKVLSQILN